MSNWPEYMTTASDEDVETYITNHKQYVPEAVEAAISELEKRGRPLSEEQITEIRNNLNEVQDRQRQRETGFGAPYNWTRNITTDSNAPELYSERAIYWQCVLFNTFFGAVILALNLRRLKRNGIGETLAFGFLYTAAIIWLLFRLGGHYSTGIGIGLNILGAGILRHYFWPKYIGKDLAYRVRPIWIPFLVFVSISLVLIFIAINGATN